MPRNNIYIANFLFVFSCCCLQTTGIGIKQSNQNPLKGISINHVPVAVPDLNKIKNLLSGYMGFTVKNGRVHAGINNCFTKFSDGTYLEFTQPLDSTETIGKFYADFLKVRTGAADMAIEVNSASRVADYFEKNNIAINTDSNRIWKSISPKKEGLGLFYIEYADKNSKDSKQNTTHANTATGLGSVYFATNDLTNAVKHFSKFGFTPGKQRPFFNETGFELAMGKTKLVLLNTGKRGNVTDNFINNKFNGVCGFSVMVSSLEKLKEQVTKNENGELIIKENNKKLYVLLRNYNLFFEFTESAN
jgi:hypothetical protein